MGTVCGDSYAPAAVVWRTMTTIAPVVLWGRNIAGAYSDRSALTGCRKQGRAGSTACSRAEHFLRLERRTISRD